MRTNIEINNNLMRQTLKATRLVSKSAVVEEGLRLLVKVHGQTSIRRLRGKVAFNDGVPIKKE